MEKGTDNAIMEEARAFAAEHGKAWERWPHGEILEAWKDEAGVLCIRYASGAWYHYATENGAAVWY